MKDKPHVIPYCRFMKLIICHLGRIHNIHQRSTSPFHLAEEDLRFGKSNSNAPYYNAYMEKVAKHDRKLAAKKEGNKKPATVKKPKPKPIKEKSSKPAPARNLSLESFQAQDHAHVGGVAIREPVTEATRPLPVVKGKDAKKGAKSDKTNSEGDTEILQIAEKLGDDVDKQVNLEEKTVELDQDQAGLDPSKTHESPDSPRADGTTRRSHIGDEQGDDVTGEVNLEDKTAEIDEDQAGSDPSETHESRPPPEQVFMDEDQARPNPRESRVALAGPDPEPTHEEFIANVYPNVQEILKFSADEHVILEEPLSSYGTLSSMKNLDDAYTIGDQLINDKATEDEPEKLNVESEVVSMVTVLIYQASASVPPLFTPVIDISSPSKPASSTTQAPIFTATKTTTTSTLTPLPQQ
ncbi:hypothetical protein Tco_0177833 [Tanacetum coccineum]